MLCSLPYKFLITEEFTAKEKTMLSAICSELDNLPVGKMQELWHPDFLDPKLKELAKYDEQIRADTTGLCSEFLERMKFKRQAKTEPA